MLFPSWKGEGTSPASIVAVLRDGSKVTVGSKLIPLASVAYLWVRSERSGYVVVPASRPAGAGVHVIRAVRAELGARSPARPRRSRSPARRGSTAPRLAVRLMPVHDEQEAAAAAARLK